MSSWHPGGQWEISVLPEARSRLWERHCLPSLGGGVHACVFLWWGAHCVHVFLWQGAHCVHVCSYGRVHTVCMWKSEDNIGCHLSATAHLLFNKIGNDLELTDALG